MLYNDLQGRIALVEYYISKQKEEDDSYNEDSYRAAMAPEEEGKKVKVPKGFPKMKDPEGGFCAGKIPIDIDAQRDQLKEVEAQIEALENANLAERFLGVVFIIFERPSHATKVIAKQGSPVLKFIVSVFCCCFKSCFPHGFLW